jgi:hypothetical protein
MSARITFPFVFATFLILASLGLFSITTGADNLASRCIWELEARPAGTQLVSLTKRSARSTRNCQYTKNLQWFVKDDVLGFIAEKERALKCRFGPILHAQCKPRHYWPASFPAAWFSNRAEFHRALPDILDVVYDARRLGATEHQIRTLMDDAFALQQGDAVPSHRDGPRTGFESAARWVLLRRMLDAAPDLNDAGSVTAPLGVIDIGYARTEASKMQALFSSEQSPEKFGLEERHEAQIMPPEVSVLDSVMAAILISDWR